MSWTVHRGDAVELIEPYSSLDLVVTDPPYAFGGSGQEHAVTATVAIVLRECAYRLKRGSWMVVFCASSWRSISYMVEAVKGTGVAPVRIGSWVKPISKTKVKTVGWSWSTVAAVAMRKGPKNRGDLSVDPESALDWIESEVVQAGVAPSFRALFVIGPFIRFVFPVCFWTPLPVVGPSRQLRPDGGCRE